jgi:hypothetical protein
MSNSPVLTVIILLVVFQGIIQIIRTIRCKEIKDDEKEENDNE